MAKKLRLFWHGIFDVRKGEYMRLTFMTLYLMLVMFAYYILKPASRALFLNTFDIDKLPYLTIMVAFIGGLLAYGYTIIAVRSSLNRAVTMATLFSSAMLVAIWWLLRFHFPWMLYVFNIWVSLFSIILVSQGWLIAANVFEPREAKRLYGILGVGAVLGAAFGGSFTAAIVPIIGTTNLLLVSALMVALSYIAFVALLRLDTVSLANAKVAGDDVAEFSIVDILGAIGRHRHLQVIISIITITFVVDVIIEYQFSAMAKQYYKGDQLTAFLGGFYGLYLNLVTFVLQLFLTAVIVSRFGIGGTLQIMPIAIGLSSLAALIAPGVMSASCLRLAEAATRYSFNRTGMELLYLPLPRDLKNRTKAFVDIFADRMARALGGVVLILVTVVFHVPPQKVAFLTVGLSVLWIALSVRAKDEYIRTVRGRLEVRKLDFESARLTVYDSATVKALEQAARGGAPRQAAYALSMLGEMPRYDIEPLLTELSDHSDAQVRSRVYSMAQRRAVQSLLPKALGELRSSRPGDQSSVLRSAVCYALAVSPEMKALAGRLLDHPNPSVVEGALEALADQPEAATELVTREWIDKLAASTDPERRRLAALAIRLRGEEAAEPLQKLLLDSDPRVISAACLTAGAIQDKTCVLPLLRRLGDPRVRGAAIQALAAYGVRIVGMLGDMLEDKRASTPVRQHIPRVLQELPSQAAVDVLIRSLQESDLGIRSSVLRALSKLREKAPELAYGDSSISQVIFDEARFYYLTSAAMMALQKRKPPTKAAGLLVRTLEERLIHSLERMFRLLGLQYPPKEVYAAYLAMRKGPAEQAATALEFLDNLLKPELRRFILPLLDEDGPSNPIGRELFGPEPHGEEEALVALLGSGDPWLVSCAIATAAEWGVKSMLDQITPLSQNSGAEVAPVALAAMEALR